MVASLGDRGAGILRILKAAQQVQQQSPRHGQSQKKKRGGMRGRGLNFGYNKVGLSRQIIS